MALTTILYDLDGTLLPMDMDVFVNGYFTMLSKKAAHVYDPSELPKVIWGGTRAMVMNDGSCTNEDAFWKYFTSVYGEEAMKNAPLFEEFYNVDFNGAKIFCGFNELVPPLIQDMKAKGLKQVLATNPLFPKKATELRIEWAGLDKDDFLTYTTYETCHYCKPNPKYYQELLEKLRLDPSECLMVGNDMDEDTPAATLGMKVFLVTDCLLNKHDRDLSEWPHGDFKDLRKYIENLLSE